MKKWIAVVGAGPPRCVDRPKIWRAGLRRGARRAPARPSRRPRRAPATRRNRDCDLHSRRPQRRADRQCVRAGQARSRPDRRPLLRPQRTGDVRPGLVAHGGRPRSKVELFLYGLIAAVGAVLPDMRAAKGGTILVGLGGSAAVGLPFASGPGPALAAARNYLHSLHGELAHDGIYVGCSPFRRSSATALARRHRLRRDRDGSPAGFENPEVDPGALAEMLVAARRHPRHAGTDLSPTALKAATDPATPTHTSNDP